MAHQWRGVIREYADRLPMLEGAPVVTLHEGGTPLIHAEKLSERVGGADRRRHAAVLERARGVEAFVLEVDLGADESRKLLGVDERGAALVQGHDGCAVEHRQPVGILPDHAAPLVGHHEPSTRITELTPRTTSSVRSRSTVADRAASVAVCVTMMRLARWPPSPSSRTSC